MAKGADKRTEGKNGEKGKREERKEERVKKRKNSKHRTRETEERKRRKHIESDVSVFNESPLSLYVYGNRENRLRIGK